jgi:hypothetical protein
MQLFTQLAHWPELLQRGLTNLAGRREERAMKPIVKILIRRALMTLGAIAVWAKALARGNAADGQTRSMPETDEKTGGVDSKSQP